MNKPDQEPRRDRTAREFDEKRRAREKSSARAVRQTQRKYIGYSVLAATVVFAIAFGAYQFSNSNSEVDPATYFPQNRPLVDSLRNLDSLLEKGKVDITRVAPIIIGLADKAVCVDLGCDPNELKGEYGLLENGVFVRESLEDFKGCEGTEKPEDLARRQSFGTTRLESRIPIFDITNISYANLKTKERRKDQATGLYKLSAHERVHANEKVVVPKDERDLNLFTNDVEKVVLRRGVRKFFEASPKDPLQCYGALNIDANFEEAIAEDEKSRIAERTLGQASMATVYTPLVDSYKARILKPLFDGDNKPILRLQQESDPDGIYKLIGEKLLPGAPEGLRKQMGQRLVVDTFSRYDP